MTACASTDHGNLGVAMRFKFAMESQGIKPIYGCEFLVSSSIRSSSCKSSTSSVACRWEKPTAYGEAWAEERFNRRRCGMASSSKRQENAGSATIASREYGINCNTTQCTASSKPMPSPAPFSCIVSPISRRCYLAVISQNINKFFSSFRPRFQGGNEELQISIY